MSIAKYSNDPALLEWCEGLLAEGAYDEAESFAKVLHEAGDHPSRLMLARALELNGKSKKASKFLGAYMDENLGALGPEMFEIAQLRGKILATMGRHKAARKSLKYALKALPDDECFDAARASTEYQLGSLLSALGSFEEAQCIFNRSMPVSCDNAWVTNARLVDFFVEPIDKNTEALSLEDLETFTEVDVSENTKLIYLVSGDLFYCQMFAPSLAKSLLKVSTQDVHLHIHGISIGKNDPGVKNTPWKKLVKSLERSGIALSFSRRHIHRDRLQEHQKKAVYSFERFNILPLFLKKFEKPVLVADIDQIPLRSPAGLLDHEFDVALLRFPKGVLNILSVVSATLSVFRPSPEGLEAARILQSYFISAMKNEAKLNWHVDQAALAVLDYKNTSSNILHLDTKLVVTDPKKYDPDEAINEGAWFWSVTNSILGNSQELESYENDNRS